MKRILTLLLILTAVTTGFGGERVQFKVSKPFAVINFMRAAGNEPHISTTLISYVRANIQAKDTAKFYKAVRQFNAINMENSFVFTEYPECRQKPKTLAGNINNAAIQANSVEEFLNRIIGMLPNEQWQKIKEAILIAEPIYDKVMGQYEGAMELQLGELRKYTAQTDRIFHKLKTFYSSTWSDDIPFAVSLFAIPGSKGNTNASPYSNSLALGVLTDEREHEVRMGVAIHEICHVLYEEQPLKIQWEIDSVFRKSKSAYAPYAYSYFDEALATACGNGWAYEQLAGKVDMGEWYNDEYINKYAKALYPIVKDYINKGRGIDKAFVKKAIVAFEQTFPDAVYEYANLLNKVNLYTDATGHEEFGAVYSGIARYIRITSSNGSYPITDAETIERIKTTEGTQFFIVYTNHAANAGVLKDIFPEIKDMDMRKEGIASFYDKRKRPVVVINVSDISRVEEAARQLQKLKRMNPDRLFVPLG